MRGQLFLPEHLAIDLIAVARGSPSAAIAYLQSHAEGLSGVELAERLDSDGPNEVAREKSVSWWLHLWHCYQNPFNLLLTVLAVLSYLSADN